MESALHSPPAMFSSIKQAFITNASVILALTVFVLSLGISELAVETYKQKLQDKAWQEAVNATKHIQETLQLKFSEALKSEALLSYLIAINGKVQPAELEALLSGLYKDSRYLRNIGIAPNNQITYLYPLAGNEQVLGLRYDEIPAQWPIVEHVIKERKAHLSGPIHLVEGTSAFLYLVPVFLKDGSYWGMISSVINTDDFLDFIQFEKGNPELEVAVGNDDEDGGGNSSAFYGNSDLLHDDYAVSVNIPVPSGNWELIIKPIALATNTIIMIYIVN